MKAAKLMTRISFSADNIENYRLAVILCFINLIQNDKRS
jgi:hypothetical protein